MFESLSPLSVTHTRVRARCAKTSPPQGFMQPSSMANPAWRSLRGKHVPWDFAIVSDLADAWLQALPQSVLSRLQAGLWKGTGPVVRVPAVTRAKAEDVEANFVWLEPVVARLQGVAAVPSSYLLGDAFLVLDARVGGVLFQGEKQQQALQEGTKLKVLVQTARALWRRNRDGGRSEEMRMLKALFSPTGKKGTGTGSELQESELQESSPTGVCEIPDSPDGLAAELTHETPEPRGEPEHAHTPPHDEYARLLRHWVEAGLPAGEFPDYFEKLQGPTSAGASSSSMPAVVPGSAAAAVAKHAGAPAGVWTSVCR
jgi:glutathione S-transferase